MDAFERFLRAGLELAGVEVDEIDVAVARAADDIYGARVRELAAADLADAWPESDLDPARPPHGAAPDPRERRRADAPAGGAGAAAPVSASAPGGRPAGHPQDLPLRDQAALVAAGDLDPRELLAATLARIGERDARLNSIVATFPGESERMLADAPPGPLHGVPVGVKDQFALPWRGPLDGTHREQLPPGESAVHTRLRAAGAVVVGATHMPFWGAASTGHTAAYGPCANPWDPERVAGGSSGGSGASVAARLVAGAVGADGAGSIRFPSAYCGITGLKPTYGAVPAEGNVHGYLTMDATGPMCRDAADARLLGSVLLARELPAGDASGLVVGIVRAPFWEDLDPGVERACRDVLAATGWQLEELALAGAEHSLIAAALRLSAEGAGSLDPSDLEHADPVFRAFAKYQLLVPAHALARADRVRALVRRSLAAAFARVDVLAWPTTLAPAPRIDNPTVELPSGVAPVDPGNVRQAGIANLAGIPAMSVPAGLHPSGLPVGLMLLGRWGAEALLLDAAAHVERATDREHVDRVPPLAAPATA